MPMSWGIAGVSGTKVIKEKQVCFDKIYTLQNGCCFVCGEFMQMYGAIEMHHTDPSEYKTAKYYDYVNNVETRFKAAHRECHNEEHRRLGIKRPTKLSEEERKAKKKAKTERDREKRRLYRLDNPLPPRPPRKPQVAWNKGLTLGALSPEHKQKISVAKTGSNCSPETRQKLSAAAKGKTSPLRGKPGRPHTEETKRKISETHKARGIRPPVYRGKKST